MSDVYHKPSNADLTRFARSWVDEMFKLFSNPKNIGENYNWKDFPEIVKSLASANLAMTYDSTKKDESKLAKIVLELAKIKIKEKLCK